MEHVCRHTHLHEQASARLCAMFVSKQHHGSACAHLPTTSGMFLVWGYKVAILRVQGWCLQ
eukprot:7414933-Alexandrium_andersonii.AAC.1